MRPLPAVYREMSTPSTLMMIFLCWAMMENDHDIDQLSATLGFKQTFREWLLTMPPDIRFHQSHQYWAHRFLENNNAAHENVASFAQLGFTESRAGLLVDWYSGLVYRQHQPILDWAKIHVDNIFQAHLTGDDNNKRYPFCGELGRRHQFPSSSSTTTNNDKLYYVNLERSVQHCDIVTRYRGGGGGDGFLFHATQHHNAVHVVENGIDIEKGNGARTFSDGCGFYLSRDIDFAIEWAKNTGDRAAIIVFRIPRQVFLAHEGLDVSSSEELWKDCVAYNLSGKARKTENKTAYRNAQYIEGPMLWCGDHRPENCCGCCCCCCYQFCIKGYELADDIFPYIDSVIYF